MRRVKRRGEQNNKREQRKSGEKKRKGKGENGGEKKRKQVIERRRLKEERRGAGFTKMYSLSATVVTDTIFNYFIYFLFYLIAIVHCTLFFHFLYRVHVYHLFLPSIL